MSRVARSSTARSTPCSGRRDRRHRRYALRVSPSLRIHADGCEVAEAAWVDGAATRRRTCRPAGDPGARRIGGRVGVGGGRARRRGRACCSNGCAADRCATHWRADLVRKAGALAAVYTSTPRATSTEPPAGVLVADHVLLLPRRDRASKNCGPTYGSLLDDAARPRAGRRSTSSGATRRTRRTCCTATSSRAT